MPNIENFFVYEYWQYDGIRHLFTLTVAAFAAGLVYFAFSSRNIAPQYRASSFLSAVVMISAVFEIYSLLAEWDRAFDYDEVRGVWSLVDGQLFSNGYRYANWCIDVPMLLTQLLIVAGFVGKAFWSKWTQFTVAGLLMIITGYIGQYYEPAVAGVTGLGVDGSSEGAGPFWIWGFVSTVFFVWIAALVMLCTFRVPGDLPLQAQKELKIIGVFLLLTWTLYPFAYGWPAWDASANGVLIRQGLYTTADITSKLVYGVMLSRICLMRSAYDGYLPAIEAGGTRALTDTEMPKEASRLPHGKEPALA